MEKNITFKKAFFGGFVREDVMDYIAAITNDFHKYKKETVQKVEEMKGKITELENAYNLILEENTSLKSELTAITNGDGVTEIMDRPDIKALIESLTESMNVLISVLSAEDQETGMQSPVRQSVPEKTAAESEPVENSIETKTEKQQALADASLEKENAEEKSAAEPKCEEEKSSVFTTLPGEEETVHAAPEKEETIDDLINKYSS